MEDLTPKRDQIKYMFFKGSRVCVAARVEGAAAAAATVANLFAQLELENVISARVYPFGCYGSRTCKWKKNYSWEREGRYGR